MFKILIIQNSFTLGVLEGLVALSSEKGCKTLTSGQSVHLEIIANKCNTAGAHGKERVSSV